MVKNRRFWIIAATAILVALMWILGAWFKFLYTPLVTDEHGMKYTVREGASIRAVINDLYLLNIVKHPSFFKLLVYVKGVAHQLKAGEYLFPKGATPPKILQQIITGSGMVYHTFMIVPGTNFRELRDTLLHDEHVRHTIDKLSDDEIMSRLGQPNLKPEGEFFPDTYFFAEGTDDVTILKRAFKAMQQKLDSAWQHRESGLPFKTSYEALIAASIIEKEFYIKEELPKIAGVLVNRLRTGMLLQFDPTVIYGVGASFDGKIHRADLLSKNPYNTYVHKGLPPTPISMPGLASIEAILHPMKHDYYYFVAQSIGVHQFSKQLSEHNKAVENARKMHWFFNYSLTRYYLLKLFSQKIYAFN